MIIKNYFYLFVACYLGTFLRLFINNNILISLIGSFLFGFVIAKNVRKFRKEILLSGFCACFTSFSGFVYFLHDFISSGDFFRFFLVSNLIIIINLLMMHFGFSISRKFT